MGTPQFVCLVAEDPQDAKELGIIAKTVLRTVPLCAVLIVGDERTTMVVEQILDELELPAPLSVGLEEAITAAGELALFSRW